MLPINLEKIHYVFHVSMWCRYRSDPSHVISLSEIEILPDITYNEELIRILAREIGDKVFLKVSPWKKILCFGCKGKLSPRFIGSYKIIERIWLVEYQLMLPIGLEKINYVFPVSMLRRYKLDPSHVISLLEIEIQPDITYNEEPIRILAREVK
ncbi:DNA/RNA polymerases superfamily protein [Gossypium australe]|uniref:DNA/RNA polymerases superfamily protein n=1 Tax=Gossypium australe TaxID=47621 RepID=A0A5B6X060_9ROSI|nr:DNA/RNA polymerases superfamily protein [Gossypium australe]